MLSSPALADTGAGDACMDLHAAGRLDEASVCYAKTRTASREVMPWAHYQGDVASRLQRDPEPFWREAIAADPEFAPPRAYLADWLISTGNAEAARPLVEWLLRRAPSSARVQYLAGMLDGSIEHFEKAVALEPAFGQAHYRLALALRKAGRGPEADSHFRLFRAHEKTHVQIGDPLLAGIRAREHGAADLLSAGRRLEEAGQWEQAADAYRKAAAADPSLAQPKINLIAVYGRLGKWEEAARSFEAAAAIAPGVPESYYNHGVALMAQQRFGEAEEPFRQAIHRNPRYADAWNNLGNVLRARGDSAGARQAFAAALDAQPRHPEANFNMARLHSGTGADSYFEAALREESARTPAHRFYYAKHLQETGRSGAALAQAELARKGAEGYGQKDLAIYLDRVLTGWRQAARR